MTKQLTSVAIPDTEMRTVHASSVEQDFRISVALPPSYGATRQRYPVLYLLDADFMFGLVTDVSRLLFFYKEIPEIIVIGIGYPVSNATGALALRTRDLTPTPNEAIYERMVDEGTLPGAPPYAGSGGAGAFLRFIHAELTAVVAESYRVEPTDAGIMGYSFGGLFALFALLTEPRSFRRYMVGSPSIWWDHDALLQIEARTAQGRDDLPAVVFMSAALREPDNMIANMYRLAGTLRQRNYVGLSLQTHVFDGETHNSGFAPFVSRALRVAYAQNT